MTPQLTILRAAELLNEDAQAGFDSCSGGTDDPKPWACPDCKRDENGTCVSQRASDERREIAAKLSFLADRA